MDVVRMCASTACGPQRMRSNHRATPPRKTSTRPSTRVTTPPMLIEATLSEADILTEVVEPHRPGLSRELAEELLSLHFNEGATDRIRELLQKNNAGTISGAEKQTLDNYLRVGEFIDLMQAKARVALTKSGPAGQ